MFSHQIRASLGLKRFLPKEKKASPIMMEHNTELFNPDLIRQGMLVLSSQRYSSSR